VAVKLTELLPAVPAATYPAVVTYGVFDTVLLNVNALVLVDMLAPVAEIELAAVAVPAGTVSATAYIASYPVSGEIVAEPAAATLYALLVYILAEVPPLPPPLPL